uniref:Reverse transcriptase Ty1/copia-type domain-containing protein n=1 Tax=Trichuris muris TaxID=70415 RepID=A0A5S6Q6E3_TRIMR
MSVKRVMRYLAATIDRKLRHAGNHGLTLQCFVDAEWAGDKTDWKSSIGYIFKLCVSTVASSSEKQSVVALSSTVVEYAAVSYTYKELLWLPQLLQDMAVPQKDPTVIYEDNQGCIRLAELGRCDARTKHIDVRYHMLRNLRQHGVITMEYCPTEDMMADVMKKLLGKEL